MNGRAVRTVLSCLPKNSLNDKLIKDILTIN